MRYGDLPVGSFFLLRGDNPGGSTQRIKELEDETGWFASAIDSINTWAREQGIEELRPNGPDSYGKRFVRYLRQFHGARNSLENRKLCRQRERDARIAREFRKPPHGGVDDDETPDSRARDISNAILSS